MIKTLLFLLSLFIIIGCDKNEKLDIDYPYELKTEVLNEINNGQRNDEGAFLSIKDNSLAYVYTCFNTLSPRDNSSSDICMIVSHDKNRKIWSSPKVLIENHGEQNIMSVSLLRLKNNSILIQYLEKNSCNDLKVVKRYSFDELDTLSNIEYLKTNEGYNVVNNDRLILANDKVYTPISRHSCNEDGAFVYNGIMELAITNKNFSTQITSIPTDDNITFQEPGIVKLSNNDLLMWFRNSTHGMLVAASDDEGISFGKPYKSIISAVPFSPSSIKSYYGDLFIVYNKYTKQTQGNKRTPLVLSISKDDMKTIDREYIIENDNQKGYMYTSIYREDSNLYLAYLVQNNNGSMVCKIIKIKNLFNGQ